MVPIKSLSKVYLIPSSLTQECWGVDSAIQQAIQSCDVFFVEHISKSVRFCVQQIPNFEFKEKEWIEIHKKEEQQTSIFLRYLVEGKVLGILSDVGCPCIADPGFRLVE